MEVTDKRREVKNFILPLLIGFFVVVLAVGNFYSILRGVYGKFTANDLKPSFKKFETVFVSQKKKVAILNSTYTRNLLPEGSTWLDDNISSWKKFLKNFNYEYEVINDNYIETNGFRKFDLLVLPGSKSLSDKQIIRIKRYLEQGGTVLATSGTASYSSDGKWRGWEFFSEVFGIHFYKEIKDEKITNVHTFRGGLPLTAGIPSGYSLKIATWDIPIAVEVLDPRSTQLSYWYDYKNEQGLVREEIKKSAGIVYGEYGKGRFVWMGFEINSVIGAFDDHVHLERLLRNFLDWLSRNPISYVRDWPHDFSAAAVIMTYLGNDFSPSSALVDIAKKKNISLNFLIMNDAVKKENTEKIKVLMQFGDIIPTIAFGYPSVEFDTSKNIFDYQTQLENINVVKTNFTQITDKNFNGVFTLYGLFNNTILKALTSTDLKYFISDSMNGNSLPKTFYWENKRITGIYKTTRDDFDVVKEYGLSDSTLQFYTYQEDIDRILFEGGLYIFKMHSQYQLQQNNIGVINFVIDDLRKKNFWLTTATEVSDWNNTKSQVEVSIKRIGTKRVRLTVFNTGKNLAQSVEVDVDLSQKAYDISITPEIIGTKLPSYKNLNGGSLIRLTIENLRSQESRIYYIDFESSKDLS